eukprot:TRINITY_DN1747_c1_g1_i1.p2 TRINITY_DN1747_c1_g1~~TRINITY_DN1747_c1_g1_i1.p2  ORF type:complete len:387 (-),score=45.60 TRINITY_DN1747_c1_g1_i1:3883-5043(-)
MMNTYRPFFSVTDQLNPNIYPEFSNPQVQDLIEEQQKIALVKQMLSGKPSLNNPRFVTPMQGPPQMPPPVPSFYPPNNMVTPRSILQNSPNTSPRNTYSQKNPNSQVDLSSLDAQTLMTLSDALAALEQLGSPNFVSPEMILQLAVQKAACAPATQNVQQGYGMQHVGNVQNVPNVQGYAGDAFCVGKGIPSKYEVSKVMVPCVANEPVLKSNEINGKNVGVGNESVDSLIPKLDFSKLPVVEDKNGSTGGKSAGATKSAKSNGSVKFRSKREKKLYKTEMCLLWSEKGHCEFGDACKYAHNEEELVQIKRHPKFKSELCRHFTETGTCPFGRRCHFVHDLDGSVSHRADSSDSSSSSSGETPTQTQTPRRLPVFQFLAHGGILQE